MPERQRRPVEESRVRRKNKFAALAILLLALVSLARPIHAQEKITVRFLDYRTGKPLKKVSVAVSFYNGEPPVLPKHVSWSGLLKTDASGEITFGVPHPVPEHLSIDPVFDALLYPGGTLPVAAVLKSGAVLDHVPKAKGPKSKPRPTAEPGLIIVLDKKMSWWDITKREIP